MIQQFFKEAFNNARILVVALTNKTDKAKPIRVDKVFTRNTEIIEEFIAKNDGENIGIYFGICSRRKPTQTIDACDAAYFMVADFDKVDIDETIKKLDALEIKPSRVHLSGNGVHAYFYLDEPTQDLERWQLAQKRLAMKLESDENITDIAHIIRAPGSHNTKNGAWREVETIRHNPERRYKLTEIEKWVAVNISPIEQLVATVRLPVDVDAMLSNMQYGNLHNTRNSVIFALMKRGDDSPSDIVEMWVNAAMAHEPPGEKWSVEKERELALGVIEDYYKKIDKYAQSIPQAVGDNVVQFRKPADKKEKKEKTNDKAWARVVQSMMENGICDRLKLYRNEIWVCRENNTWEFLDSRSYDTYARGLIHETCLQIGIAPVTMLVNQVKNYISQQCTITNHNPLEWDKQTEIACQEVFLHPETHATRQITPEDRVTFTLNTPYDKTATCPTWSAMLADIFMGDEDTINMVQEIVGSFLLPIRSREKNTALVFVGESRTGKSQLLNVLGGFLSDKNITTSIESIERPHGTMAFLRNDPWILHEAFDGRTWHKSDTLKAILTGDAIEVNVKHGGMYPMRYRRPIIWGTNYMPTIKEDTNAIVNRLTVVRCLREWKQNEVSGAALTAKKAGYPSAADYILATERPGILNWALEGLRRVNGRGFFSSSEKTKKESQKISFGANWVRAFVDECCVSDDGYMVRKADFFVAAAYWAIENARSDGRSVTTPTALATLYNRAFPSAKEYSEKVYTDTEKKKRVTLRYWDNIKLNEEGLHYFNNGRLIDEINHQTNLHSEDVNDVNRSKKHG